MTFEQFIETARWHRTFSQWIVAPGLKIYMRKGYRPDEHGDYVIANIKTKRPGKGALTRFLDTYETKYRFSFEAIVNPRLGAYLYRRGYRIVPELSTDHAPTMISPKRG